MSWGPVMWHVIHSWAVSYPDKPTDADIEGARKYYNDLPGLIPCPRCAAHFARILELDPVEPWLYSRRDLAEWTWRIHNTVSISLNKPSMSLDEFYNVWKPSFVTKATGGVVKRLYGMLAGS